MTPSCTLLLPMVCELRFLSHYRGFCSVMFLRGLGLGGATSAELIGALILWHCHSTQMQFTFLTSYRRLYCMCVQRYS